MTLRNPERAITILHTELNTYIRAYPSIATDYGVNFDIDDPDDDGGISGLMPSNKNLEQYVEFLDDRVIIDPMEISTIRVYASFVAFIYDGMYGEPASTNAWNALGLAGDGDVDYCGSHVDGMIDIIEAYLKHIAE